VIELALVDAQELHRRQLPGNAPKPELLSASPLS